MAWLELSRMGQLIHNTYVVVAQRLRNRRGRLRETHIDPGDGEAHKQWELRWVDDQPTTKDAVQQEWIDRLGQPCSKEIAANLLIHQTSQQDTTGA